MVYSVIGEFWLYFLCVLDSQKAFLFAFSVRIYSQATYNNGLFILDLNTAPWGCGSYPFSFDWSTYLDASVIKAVWPAFWTVGADWPSVRAQTFFGILYPYLTAIFQGGEIDILEGVHDNQHNQIAWHTSPGKLTFTSFFFSSHLDIKVVR